MSRFLVFLFWLVLDGALSRSEVKQAQHWVELGSREPSVIPMISVVQSGGSLEEMSEELQSFVLEDLDDDSDIFSIKTIYSVSMASSWA